MNHLRLSIIGILTLLIACSRVSAQTRFRVMEWNVENLFDTAHDYGRNDLEFTPESERQWNSRRYWKKLDDIARIITIVGDGEPPALVGLCEVENDTVMRDLTKRSSLRTLGYDYLMTDSPDERGVDVALMYKRGLFLPLGHECLRVPSVENNLKPTRDILHVWGRMIGDDTLHAMVCHLPSKAGDSPTSAHHRRLAVQTIAHAIDSLIKQDPDIRLILMGDFNTDPRDRVFKLLCPPMHTLMPTKWKELQKPQGTYYYQKLWSYIDHMLVTAPLLYDENEKNRAQAARFDWMKRTYGGTAYLGGISDHQPLYWDLPTRSR